MNKPLLHLWMQDPYEPWQDHEEESSDHLAAIAWKKNKLVFLVATTFII